MGDTVMASCGLVRFMNISANCWRKSLCQMQFKQSNRYFSISSNLTGRLFNDKHEWVDVVEEKGKIGITDYAQESLGDIVYAQIPQIGDKFSQGDECGALESVKAVSEMFCPVSGTVTAVNADVEEHPGLVNEKPYTDGWLFEVELTDPEELAGLMDEAAYNNFCKAIEE